MSALANITLADGAATPVVHTFSPVRIDSAGVATLADRSGGIPLGYPLVTMSVREPTKTSVSRVYKVTAKVFTPVLDITSPSTTTGIQPAPSKAYDLVATLEFNLPERSTLQQRKDLFAFAKNLFADANMVNAVQNFESIY